MALNKPGNGLPQFDQKSSPRLQPFSDSQQVTVRRHGASDPRRLGAASFLRGLAVLIGLSVGLSLGLCACGSGSGVTGSAASTSTATPTLSAVAGSFGGSGNADGPVAYASFTGPTGVVQDTQGNVYVADKFGHTIRRISNGEVTTFAGSPGIAGSADGTGSAAGFNNPSGVAVDSAGNVYVADYGNDTIRRITPAGTVTTIAGIALTPGHADGPLGTSTFYSPAGVAVDATGNVYVADQANSLIRMITPDGTVSTIAGILFNYAWADGSYGTSSFNQPFGIAVDGAGNVYVGDDSTRTVRKITAGVVSTIGGIPGTTSSINGPLGTSTFQYPAGVSVDGAGNVYVADDYDSAIRMITSGNVTSMTAGSGGPDFVDGLGTAASFNDPAGVWSDASGNLLVADYGNTAIRQVTPAGAVSTLAGFPLVTGSTDGPVATATFDSPYDVAADGAGNLYIADGNYDTLRMLAPSGMVTTFAGIVRADSELDGLLATATFADPVSIAFDGAGNLYVCDHDSGVIRMISPGGMASHNVGTGWTTGSYSSTIFRTPQGVAADSTGNVYVADTDDSGTNGNVYKISPSGVVSIFAGTGVAGNVDGPTGTSQVDGPHGVATDGAGNVYVSDLNALTIRKITPAGNASTVAGIPYSSGTADGPAAAATFSQPMGIAVDAAGDIYVAEAGNNTIRKISGGVVSTVVGSPTRIGFSPGSLPGVLNSPQGLRIAGSTLYVVTGGGVAKVTPLP